LYGPPGIQSLFSPPSLERSRSRPFGGCPDPLFSPLSRSLAPPRRKGGEVPFISVLTLPHIPRLDSPRPSPFWNLPAFIVSAFPLLSQTGLQIECRGLNSLSICPLPLLMRRPQEPAAGSVVFSFCQGSDLPSSIFLRSLPVSYFQSPSWFSQSDPYPP